MFKQTLLLLPRQTKQQQQHILLPSIYYPLPSIFSLSTKLPFSTTTTTTNPPTTTTTNTIPKMSPSRFQLLKQIIEAPSPVNLEGAMTMGVIEPFIKQLLLTHNNNNNHNHNWKIHKFIGNAGIVIDTLSDHQQQQKPPNLTIMIMGHADKIRMQVRHIQVSSGKIYIDSDSFLPIALLGNDVSIYSEKPNELGQFNRIRGTVEALGAIHFGDAGHRNGTKGVSPEQLYIDLGVSGKDVGKRIMELGIKPGDAVLMDRPIRKTVGDDGFSGAYLDNGIGSFIVTDLARLVLTEEIYSNSILQSGKLRLLFAIAAHEEIGRFGSRVLANLFQPDVLMAVDVNHDYENAPGVASKRFPPVTMGGGFTISVGAVASRKLNEFIQIAAKKNKIPYQLDCVGRDTGTDAMGGVLGSVDCAVASLGVPTRNMHTASETASTKDVDACLYGIAETLKLLGEENITRQDFYNGHVDLSKAVDIFELPQVTSSSSGTVHNNNKQETTTSTPNQA
jgi:putative aminopeptidase FrvX